MTFRVLIFAAFLLGATFSAQAQYFKDAFDQQFLVSDPTGDGTAVLSGLSSLSASNYDLEIGNGIGTYQTLTGPMMQGLIRMYHGTGQPSYLRDFVRVSYQVQMHRDDLMQGSNQGDSFSALFDETIGDCGSDPTFTPGVDVARPVAATWSIYYCREGNMTWFASAVYSGEILYPMAEFVHLIKVEKPSLAGANCVLSGFATWGDYANWLEVRIKESIDAHTDQGFDYNHGVYRRDVFKKRWFGSFVGYRTAFWSGVSEEGIVQHNFATAMARVFAVVHDYTTDYALKIRVRNYLARLKYNWENYAGLEVEGSGYVWKHGQHARNKAKCREEMSHGAYAVQQALLCYEYGITDASGNLIYDLNFVRRLVYTFTRNAYHQPLDIGPGVDGTQVCYDGCYCNDSETVDCNVSCQSFPEKHVRGSGPWVVLSNTPATYNSYDDYIDRDIYNILMDVNLYYSETIWPNGAAKTGTPPLNYGFQAMYYKKNKEILDPITAWRVPGPGSAWAGADVGDVTGDGEEEVVAVRNFAAGGKVFALKVGEHPSYSHLNQFTSVTSINPGNLQFADLAVGDLDPTHEGDEIIAATNLNAHLIMYSYNGSTIVQQTAYTLANGSSQWRGVAVGDFVKGNGKDEFVAVRNLDGKFFLFEYNPGTNQLQGITSWSGPANYNWSRLDAGDIDNDGHDDDIVALNNATGDILTYYYDDGTNTMVPGASYTASGATSNWTDVAIGNFCRHDQEKVDIMVRRALDGDMTVFRADGSSLVATVGTFFTSGQKVEVLGAGNFHGPNRKDELVAFRNIDGDVFAFNVKTSCKITGLPAGPSFVNEPGSGGNGNGGYFDHPDFPSQNPHGTPPGLTGKKEKQPKDLIVPNPNSGRFIISSLTADAQVEIVDAAGTPVPFIRNGREIDISSLADGLYICRIIKPNLVTSLRVVKQ